MSLRRRGFAIWVALAFMGLLLVGLAPTGQSLAFADQLRLWEADSSGEQQRQFFILGSGEGYDNYIFHAKPGDDVPLAVVNVEVLDLSGNLVCRGVATYTLDTLNVLRSCPDLRVGHHYELHWIADRAGTGLHLSGY